jgi:N-acetylneuraminate synthase
LVRRAKELGITLFSTPFDESAVKLLRDLDVPAYKIASFEVVDLPLIECVARQKKPMIISTGMASCEEIADAVRTTRRHGTGEIVLLHCVSSYPARYDQANLRTVADLANSFDAVVGLSDHTPGTACAVAAVAMGACVIEKHFTLNRADGGPDSAFSLEPNEFKRLVEDCRAAWMSLGCVDYRRGTAERESLVYRRSLYVVEDVAVGEALTSRNIRSIRPGYGLPPKLLAEVLGRRAAHALKRGQPLRWQDLA